MKDDLEKKIAELVFERDIVPARNRIGHLVSLLERVGRDRRKALLAVPRTATLRIAQTGHDGEQTVERTAHFRVTPGQQRYQDDSTPAPQTRRPALSLRSPLLSRTPDPYRRQGGLLHHDPGRAG